MNENTNQYSTKHSHEPEIPATYDDEGRCLICVLLVQVAQLEECLRVLEKLVVGKVKGGWPDDDGTEPKGWEGWSLQLYGVEAGDFLFGQEAWDHIQRGLVALTDTQFTGGTTPTYFSEQDRSE